MESNRQTVREAPCGIVMRGTAVREWHAQRVRPRAVALDLALVLLVARVHDPPERLGEVDFHQEPLGLAGQGHSCSVRGEVIFYHLFRRRFENLPLG